MSGPEAFWPNGYFAELAAFITTHQPDDPGLQELVQGNVERAAREVTAMARRDAHEILEDQRAESAAFNLRLDRRWGAGLDLLDLVVDHSRVSTEQVDMTHRQDAVVRQDFKFEALMRLQYRAMMVAQEVAVLLRHGFATGAMARWRTLHEIWVVASVLGDADGSVSHRYLLHPQAEDLRARKDYEETWEALGRPGPEWSVEDRLADRKRLQDEHGAAFTGHYGWAAPLFGGESPSFVDLQASADLAHWRSLYRDASHGTHANPTGVTWNLQGMDHVDSVFHGPSDAGLFEPARCTLMALAGLTTSLLLYALDLFDDDEHDWMGEADTLVRQSTSIYLCQAAVDAFDEIASEQEEQEATLTEIIGAVRAELAVTPELTAEEIQLRVGYPLESLMESLDRAEARRQLSSVRRYSQPH